MIKENPTVQLFLKENVEFQKLYEEHLKYERQLEELDKVHYLTPEQEMQRKTIQKLKLSGKDQMSRMVRQAQPQ
jgi:uncharacterized protein YdcH (DUF465 family)